MKKTIKILVVLVVALLLAVVAAFHFFGTQIRLLTGRPLYLIPPSPVALAEEAIYCMNLQGLYAEGDAWQQAKETLRKEAEAAESREAVYDAIDRAAKVAGGKHSAYYAHEKVEALPFERPTAKIQDDVLVLHLPGFMGTAAEGKIYAKILSDAIEAGGYRRIVVDLTDNDGGNMYPMLAGLSATLDDGVLFRFRDRHEQTPDVEIGKANIPGAEKKSVDVPVEVQIGPGTASSGEMVALAYKGADNATLTGEPTAGYNTANILIPLYESDLQLTTSKTVDREGEVWEDRPIPPDGA